MHDIAVFDIFKLHALFFLCYDSDGHRTMYVQGRNVHFNLKVLTLVEIEVQWFFVNRKELVQLRLGRLWEGDTAVKLTRTSMSAGTLELKTLSILSWWFVSIWESKKRTIDLSAVNFNCSLFSTHSSRWSFLRRLQVTRTLTSYCILILCFTHYWQSNPKFHPYKQNR